jgi:hypothetical protein
MSEAPRLPIVEPRDPQATMATGLTAKQLTERLTGIGGSDAGAIISGDWRDLWLEKTGRQPAADLSGILPVQMGIFTEPFNAIWYTRQTGRTVQMRNMGVVHPKYPYLRANLDGVTTTADGHSAYIDFKHVGRSGDQLTVRYTAQGTHCALILSAILGHPVDWWVLSCFVGNSKWELTEQEIDPFFASEYLAKCAEFWRHVERDEEPLPAPALPVPAPRKWRTVTIDTLNPASNWEYSIIPKVNRFVETEEHAKANAAARESIKEILPDDVGKCVVGFVDLTRDKAGKLTISTKRLEKANG